MNVRLALPLLVITCLSLAAESLHRSVRGVVVDSEGQPIPRAVVKLQDRASLDIRSFLTKEDGTYQFQGLHPDREYRLRARYQETWGPRKTLSAFDSRPEAIVNLKVNVKHRK